MIDFTKLASAIPKEGTLKLLFNKKDKTITACVVLAHKGKEENANFAPIVLKGTAEELTKAFEKDIPEIASLSQDLYEKLEAPAVIAKKKADMTKAIAKTGARDQKGTEAEKEKAEDTKEPPKPAPPPMDDLFGIPAKPAEPPVSAGEAPEPSENADEEQLKEAAGGGL